MPIKIFLDLFLSFQIREILHVNDNLGYPLYDWIKFVNFLGYEKSKLFSNTPKHILHILKSKNVTHNLHRYSITEEILNKHRLLDQWRILSTNRGDDENKFISSMEHKNFPIYGIQFHPEKNIFEFKKNYGIPHSADAVKSAQFFANFFVDECRKNNNGFPSEELEENSLIYNYIPLYTGLNGSSHVQLYVFSKDDYTKCLLVWFVIIVLSVSYIFYVCLCCQII